MGANWSDYNSVDNSTSHVNEINNEKIKVDASFSCYICNKQKKELRIESLACNHISCVDCLSTSSFLGQGLLKDVHHDTVISYYPPTKGLYKVPGLCSVCFVENAIKSPNFHNSAFYFKRNHDENDGHTQITPTTITPTTITITPTTTPKII